MKHPTPEAELKEAQRQLEIAEAAFAQGWKEGSQRTQDLMPKMLFVLGFLTGIVATFIGVSFL